MSDNERAGDVPQDRYITIAKSEWQRFQDQSTRIAELQAELAECSYGESNVKSYREIAETIDRQDAELTALRARREADCRAMGEAKEEIDVALNWLKWCCGDVGCESKLEAALSALAARIGEVG